VLRPELARLFGEVEQDCARLHEMQPVLCVDDGRDLVVRRYSQEGGIELLVFQDIEGVSTVGQTDLLEHDRDLLPVRRHPSVKLDHCPPLPISVAHAMRQRMAMKEGLVKGMLARVLTVSKVGKI